MASNRALGIMGVAWLDEANDLGKGLQTLAEIISRVAKAHERRLGVPPNLVQVHPDVVKKPQYVGDIWVEPQHHILKQHYHAVRVENKLPKRKEPNEGTALVLEITIGGNSSE